VISVTKKVNGVLDEKEGTSENRTFVKEAQPRKGRKSTSPSQATNSGAKAREIETVEKKKPK